MGLDATTKKRIADAGLRKVWSTLKKNELAKLAKDFPEDAKSAAKIFDQGLGPELDNFYKLLAAAKPDKKAIQKSHAKLNTIMAGYKQAIAGSNDFTGNNTMVLNGVIEHMSDEIEVEWKFIDKHVQ